MLSSRLSLQPAPASPGHRPYTAVMIIPTGVGAAIGGFAGDALPVARALASIVDCLITHPNVSSGSCSSFPVPKKNPKKPYDTLKKPRKNPQRNSFKNPKNQKTPKNPKKTHKKKPLKKP